ncbi:hypothetical protein ACJRO7_000319 [Eucalyptus globulus]|uniref:MLO-like protein n=1 Tax=Eucalyptus globulus TaxID=34317 RepID=A0ABD3LM82_EUCGL
MAYSGVEGKTLEFTPSWVVALVCFSIVLISLAVDKFLQCVGQLLNKSEWKTLVGAFRKIKEELMLLGFISLLLAVFQTRIEKICIPERLANVWLPCKKLESSSTTALFTNFFRSSETRGRRLLVETSPSTDFCAEKGKVPLLMAEALHHLDIFIFVLGTFHVILCVIKIVLGYEKIHQWNKLANHDDYHKLQQELLEEQKNRGCLANLAKKSKGLGWMFYPSVTKFEYLALRLNFMARDLHQPKEEFQNSIIDVVRKDFEKIVGISWYLWIFAVIFLLVNVAGWHAYFWISFIPLTLLLIAGTILERMITRLAEEVAQKKSEKEVVKFRRGYFWFRKHQFVLHLIHIVLFQNSLELIFFFFVLFQYDFHSCIMGRASFAVSRIVIGAFVQFMCIYRTLPLYAIMKSQCRDIHSGKNPSGEEEDMWIVTQIWNWYNGRKSKRVATNECAENGSRHRSAGTTEQMKGGEVELETKADIEAPAIRECTSEAKNN